MPGHPDHQASVMTPVGGPPGLAFGHQRFEIGLKSFKVQRFKGLAVIKTLAVGVDLGIVLMQNIQVQRFGPPRGDTLSALGVGTVNDGAFSR